MISRFSEFLKKEYIHYSEKFDEEDIFGAGCFKCVEQGTDLVFVIDISGSIGKEERDYEEKFLDNFVKLTQKGAQADTTRVAFVFFEHRPYIIDFQRCQDFLRKNGKLVQTAFNTVEKMMEKGSITNTHKAIAEARIMFTSKPGNRFKVPGDNQTIE